MTSVPRSTRQPVRDPWPIDKLVRERAIALGFALDKSTHKAYASHLQSYIAFCDTHDFPLDPTPDTLSFYVVYMSHFIKPTSVDTYLSGIASQLESFYPSVRDARKSALVTRYLAGCKKRFSAPKQRKRPITVEDLLLVRSSVGLSPSHDDKLFVTLTYTGFFGLHRLGELVWPDDRSLRTSRKLLRRRSVVVSDSTYGYDLPAHKADRYFAGSSVVIERRADGLDPGAPFLAYLASRDSLFPFHPALFLLADSSVPTRAWYLSRLQAVLGFSVAGHSLRPGGATFLASLGWPDAHLQAAGRWSSEAYKIYVREHPVLLQASLQARRRAFDTCAAARQPSISLTTSPPCHLPLQ